MLLVPAANLEKVDMVSLAFFSIQFGFHHSFRAINLRQSFLEMSVLSANASSPFSDLVSDGRVWVVYFGYSREIKP